MENENLPEIIVASNSALFCKGLTELLRRKVRVHACTSCFSELTSMLITMPNAPLIISNLFPGFDITLTVQTLAKNHPATKVMVTSPQFTCSLAKMVIDNKCVAYVPENAEEGEFKKAVIDLLQNKTYMPVAVYNRFTMQAQHPVFSYSPEKYKLYMLWATGHTHTQICNTMPMNSDNVYKYKKCIARQLNFDAKTTPTVYAFIMEHISLVDTLTYKQLMEEEA